MKEKKYDVIVIGGGPAGMMAAGRAAERGARVLLLEKNLMLGKKLLITGGGRSNITNAEFDLTLFLKKFKKDAKFLYSSFSQFDSKNTIEFFEALDMPTKIEAEKRVFPKSDSAESVLDALIFYMKKGSVDIRYGAAVSRMEVENGSVCGVYLKNNEKIEAGKYILATGGKSHPETGSTGDGFAWLKKLGHALVEPKSALVPIAVRENWIKKLAGMSLKDVKATVYIDGKKQFGNRGKILLTHVGLSGPLILNMSREIGESLKYGFVRLSIDFFPSLDMGALDRNIQEIFHAHQNKKLKSVLGKLVVPILGPVLGNLLQIDSEKFVNKVSREERLQIVRLLKDFRFEVSRLLGAEKAIVTSGGVDLKEVDFKTMRSRLYPNLYIVGDVLNIDRPSGGYSLQLCWTTGFVAGESAAGK